VTQKAERMRGDRYERPKGTSKAPMDPEAAFMQVLSNLVVSQQTMTQSLAQLADRLAIVDTPGTPAPHATHFFDLSVHASDLPSSSDHEYFYAICLYSGDDP
jgi:hypothetical protein